MENKEKVKIVKNIYREFGGVKDNLSYHKWFEYLKNHPAYIKMKKAEWRA
jgi:hypothetical protein